MHQARTAITLSLAALLAAPAAAKEGVRAKADGKVKLDVPAGKTLRVTWRLTDARNRPFGAGGIYLRLSRCNGRPLAVTATALGSGRYRARFRVPRGGIRRLTVGLQGWRMYPAGRRERADVIFGFDPPLSRRCPR